ncbi:MAG: 3-deoxy-manno-octulosonate cytidylyltransferase, partial [bacterium]
WTARGDLLQHVGVYCYRRAFLLRFARLPRTALERRERLEQLRVLEYGIRPRVVVADTPALSVDTQHDLIRAHEWLNRRARSRGGA